MKKTLLQLSLAAFLTVSAFSANATIVDHGTYFNDNTTNIDWLNNQPLAGQSYESVMAGYGGYIDNGWRYATGEEVAALIETYVYGGPVNLNSSNGYTEFRTNIYSYISAAALIENLGINVSFGNPPDPRSTYTVYSDTLTGTATQAMYNNGDDKSKVAILDIASYNESSNKYAMIQMVPDIPTTSLLYGRNISSILVRANPVPEPEIYAMMLAGLGLIGFAARKNKSKKIK